MIEKDSDPKVGDYYYKDGTWSPEVKTTSANPIIGVVYKVFATGDEIYGKALGRVVSLTEPTNLKWTESSSITEPGATSSTNGKENTDKIFAGVSAGTYILRIILFLKPARNCGQTPEMTDGIFRMSETTPNFLKQQATSTTKSRQCQELNWLHQPENRMATGQTLSQITYQQW